MHLAGVAFSNLIWLTICKIEVKLEPLQIIETQAAINWGGSQDNLISLPLQTLQGKFIKCSLVKPNEKTIQ